MICGIVAVVVIVGLGVTLWACSHNAIVRFEQKRREFEEWKEGNSREEDPE